MELRNSIIDSFTFKWGMFKDEVTEIVDSYIASFQREMLIQSENTGLDCFHGNLLALLTKTNAVEWVRSARLAFDEEDFGLPFQRRHGGDVFAAYQMTHKDGRVAQIEYDSEDFIFADCGELVWSAPIEDDVVRLAEEQSQSQGRYGIFLVNPKKQSIERVSGK